MDPSSVTASVIGIMVPALDGVRLLIDDIRNIREAPVAIRSLGDDLVIIDNTLASLQAISEQQWQFLGETVVIQSKSTIKLCADSCQKFRASLSRWTRHGGDGKLSWRDQAVVGVFKQGQMKSMAEQLQNCELNLTTVATTASL